MQDLPGEIARLLGGEHHRAVRHVLHAAEASKRQLGEPPRPILGCHHVLAHVRLDAARRDGVHRDAVAAHLGSERARERLHGPLRRRIGGEAATARWASWVERLMMRPYFRSIITGRASRVHWMVPVTLMSSMRR